MFSLRSGPSRLPALALPALVLAVAAQGEGAPSADDKPSPAALVHTHPVPIGPTDELRDGENGKRIEVSSDTLLVWVDRMPEARFEHPTEYVLVSDGGTRVVEGGWWPVLNGKPLFRGDEAAPPVALNRPGREP